MIAIAFLARKNAERANRKANEFTFTYTYCNERSTRDT